MKNESVYICRLQGLHRHSIPGRWDHSTFGKAPHKPLLFLCVTDLYRENPSRANRIEPTLYIEESFNDYWRLLYGRDNVSTFALPFFHLQHDEFWFLVGTNSGTVDDPEISRTSASLRKAVAFARLDDGLHKLLQRPEWVHHLRSVTISSNFAPDAHSRFINR